MQSRSAASTAEVSSVLLSPLAFHGGNITLQILGEAAAGGESSSSSKKVIFVNRGGVVVVVGYMKVGARARHGDVSAACTLQGCNRSVVLLRGWDRCEKTTDLEIFGLQVKC